LPVRARTHFVFFYAVRLVVVIIIITSRGARALLRRPRDLLTRLRFNGIRKKTCDDNINKERAYARSIGVYIILYTKTVKRFFRFELNFFLGFLFVRVTVAAAAALRPYRRVFRQSDVLSSRLVGRSCCRNDPLARLRLRRFIVRDISFFLQFTGSLIIYLGYNILILHGEVVL